MKKRSDFMKKLNNWIKSSEFIPEQSVVEKLVQGPLKDATSHLKRSMRVERTAEMVSCGIHIRLLY